MSETVLPTASGTDAGPIPLTNAQRLMWTGQRLAPDVPLYNMAMAFTIEGALDADRFQEAFQSVVDRSDAMRTVVEDGRARVLSSFPYTVERVDLSGTPDPEAAAHAWTADRVRRTIDLGAGTFDTALLRLGAERHVWFFDQHHLAADAWSLTLIYRAVAAAYEQSETADLPAFRDYVEHEQTAAQSPAFARAAAYWQDRQDLEPVALYGRSGDPSATATEAVVRRLGAERSGRLRALAADPAVRSLTPHLTLFNLFAAALFAYVHRVSGGQRLVIGVPSHNRPTASFKETIGLFIEVLPFAVEVDEDETFRSLVAKVSRETVTFLRHALPGTSTAAGNRGCNVLLNYVNVSFGPFAGRPVQTEWVHAGHSDSGDDVCLQVFDFDGTGDLTLRFVLSETLFTAEERRAAADHFVRLLDAMLDDVAHPIAAADLLSPEERHRLVTEWNETAALAPPAPTLHAWFESQAARTPEAVAVRFEDEALTYAALNGRANRVAHRLRSLGVAPGVLVGVCMERSVELVVALLGVLKSGGAYVPLDPEHPAARRAFMAEDAATPVVLTQRHLRARVPDTVPTVLCLDDASATTDAFGSSRNPDPLAGPRDLAYVIYTSGSTGRPKGAMNEHRAVVNRLAWMQSAYALGGDDRVLQKTPFSFDVSVWEFFWPLVTGAPLVVARPGGHKDSAYLSEVIEAAGITTAHFVPSMLRAFLDEPSIARCQSLRRVICSGEALPVDLAQRLFERLPGVELHNLYGPTECAIDVTHWTCRPELPEDGVPIGRPIANTQTYVLDRRMQPVPVGVPGELYIGGVPVGRGYLNRPELTAERFIADPFSADPDTRLYRTGDLARWRPDGTLAFLGRLDFQVKVRGFRIELGEIEAALRGHEAVRAAVVVASQDLGPTRLVAYYVADAPVPPAALRGFLAGTLPEYMVPARFVRLDALPLTTSGKVDRRALPVLSDARDPDEAAARVPPRTEAERTLAALWADVLRVPEVGATDNFFDLGGDSILAIQIAARAAEAGLKIPPGLLFQHQTVAALASAAAAASGPPAEQGVVTGDAPLLPVQRWFATQSHPAPYDQTWAFDAREPLDERVLQAALDAVVRHHDALRGRLDGDRQTFAFPEPVPLTTLDLSDRSAEEQARALADAEAEAHAGVDPTSGPLVRAVHARLGDRDRLVVVVHHLGVDGVSWPILMGDLERAYRQAARGEAVALPPKTVSFRRWAEALAAHARSPEVRAATPRWAAEFEAATGRLHAPDAGTEAEAQTHTVTLTTADTEAVLKAIPAAHDARVTEVLLAALASALGPRAEGGPLRVDVESHGRDALDLDVTRTVGWFTTIAPVALPLDAAPGEAVRRVRDRLRARPEASTCGLAGSVLEAAPPAVLFNYLGRLDDAYPDDALFRPTGPLTLTRHPDLERPYPIEVNVWVEGGRLVAAWTGGADLAPAASAFADALRALASKTDDAPASVDLSLAGLDADGLDRLAALLRAADA